jgi:hypothetical protein
MKRCIAIAALSGLAGLAFATPSGNRTTIYTYHGEGSRPNIQAGGVAAIRGGLTACQITFEVDSGGTIVKAAWTTEGSQDRERSRRTCWREFKSNKAK